MKSPKFTQSQQVAITAFKSFLESGDQVFLLKGAAGTGKTTLVSEFLNILNADKRNCRLMAPTGRAAYILGNNTNHEATTIHRAIYGLSRLKFSSDNKDTEDDGGLHLRFGLKANNDSPDTVYIVDEASMISDNFSDNETFSFGSGCLLTDIFEFANRRKIVFVGDYAQLPPIGMNFSPAMDKDYFEIRFHCKVTEIMLREVMRQSAGSVMLSNALIIRDCIENKSFIEFKLDKGVDSEIEDKDLLTPYFQLSPHKPGVKSVVIAYSNRQALDYNLAIRRHYYGDSVPRLQSGDLLMISRNNYSFDYELFNGSIVSVKDCQPDNEIIQRRVRVKTGKDKIESVDLRFRKATIRFGVNHEPVSLNVTILDNFLDDPNGSLDRTVASALIIDFNNRLPEKLKSHHSEILRLLKSPQNMTVEQTEMCESYLKLLKSDPYYNSVICKYGYAITCHKAQGGEWENVFADMYRAGGTANENYFRWAYTAITRASKKIWHSHSPEFDYISGLVVGEIKPSPKIKVSNYSEDKDFCEARFRRILMQARKFGLSVSEDKSKSYQHLITFTDDKSDTATVQLWYHDKGYSNKYALVSSTSEALSEQCATVIDASYAPESVPFNAPERPFAEQLVSLVRSLLEELDIQLLDITQESYQDVFHLKTDGIAQVGFTYTGKGNYSSMRLLSSLGPDDTKLQALRKRFI